MQLRVVNEGHRAAGAVDAVFFEPADRIRAALKEQLVHRDTRAVAEPHVLPVSHRVVQREAIQKTEVMAHVRAHRVEVVAQIAHVGIDLVAHERVKTALRVGKIIPVVECEKRPERVERVVEERVAQ